MKVLRSLGVVLLAVLIGGLASAQVTEISKEEFSEKYFGAVEKAQALARRETVKAERFREGGLVEKDEWILEYDDAFRSRIAHSTKGLKASRTEMIVSEEKVFCRSEAEAWKLVDRLCLVGPIFNQVLGIVSSKHSVQDAVVGSTRARLYQEYVTHENPFLANKGDGQLRFMETKFWLNEKGLILKRHVRVGIVATDKVSFEEIYAFEYDPPGLKIDVPIL